MTAPARDPVWLRMAMWFLGGVAFAVAAAILLRGAVGCGLDFIGAVTR